MDEPDTPSCHSSGPQELIACFALYLKIVNTFFENNASYRKLSKELNNSNKI